MLADAVLVLKIVRKLNAGRMLTAAFRRRSVFRSGATLATLVVLASCARARPDFGTMPKVVVPIQQRPPQDPTLFQEDAKKVDPANTDLPDPEPLRTRHQYDYVIGFNKGEVSVVSVTAGQVEQPLSTERRMGRFAFELWAGKELVERVRFDFPLLGAGSADEEDPLAAGLSTTTKLRVPQTSSASAARIIDRKTRKVVVVDWPPVTNSAETSP